MKDVLVVCEGQTERDFVNRLLAPLLADAGVALQGTLVGKPQKKRGGIRAWPVYEKELLRLAKERANRTVAVLVDYYAMPDSWPGRVASAVKPHVKRGRWVEDQLMEESGWSHVSRPPPMSPAFWGCLGGCRLALSFAAGLLRFHPHQPEGALAWTPTA